MQLQRQNCHDNQNYFSLPNLETVYFILRSYEDALLNSLFCIPFYGCGFIFRKRLAKQLWSYSKSPSLRLPGTAQAESIPSSAASTWTVTLSACGALTSGHRAIFGEEKLQMNDPMLGILQICMRHVLLWNVSFLRAPNTDE